VRRRDAIKFKNVLLPGQRFSLEVTRTFNRPYRNLDFSLTCGDIRISSGRLVLRS
jgi:3-hydroxymyristoyl/3-hydroxydecanoyl-(acyl carrier protein) dehydratase